jgi:hypothetical protein
MRKISLPIQYHNHHNIVLQVQFQHLFENPLALTTYLAGWLEGLLQVLGQKPQPVHLLLAQREVQLHAAVAAAAAAAARIADARVVVVPALAAVVAAAAAVVATVVAVTLDLDGRLAQLTAEGEELLFKLLQPLQRLFRSAHLRRGKGLTSVKNDRQKNVKEIYRRGQKCFCCFLI